MLKLVLAVLLATIGAAPAKAESPLRPLYAEGQVWEYRTRPQEQGSLLRIQRIESLPEHPAHPVYHISIVGVRIAGLAGDDLPHLPVSRETLDASVTRLSSRTVEFPSADEGIAMWREARGGVFTVTVAEVVGFAERAVREAQGQEHSH